MDVGSIKGLAVLTGFSYNRSECAFCQDKKGGHNNEVTILTRRLYGRVHEQNPD